MAHSTARYLINAPSSPSFSSPSTEDDDKKILQDSRDIASLVEGPCNLECMVLYDISEDE
jgi:hypothetical protein